MKLRARLMIWFAIATLCATAGLSYLTATPQHRNATFQEDQRVLRNIACVSRAMNQFSVTLSARATEFAEPRFARSQLTEEQLAWRGVDALVVLDPRKKIVSTVFARPGASDRRMRAGDLTRLVDKATLERAARGQSVSGISQLGGRPLFLAVRRIPGADRRSWRGWVIAARRFGAAELADLKQTASLDLSVDPISRLKKQRPGLYAALGSAPSSAISRQDEQTILGGAVVRDLRGQAAFAISFKLDRVAYAQGLQTIAVQLRWIACIAIAFALILFASVERLVFRRVNSLSTQVEKCVSKQRTAKVAIKGSDELSWLAHQINLLLEALAKRAHRIEENESMLRVYNEELENKVLERTRHIEHQAYHDALTGLPNRLQFLERLAEARAKARKSGRPFAVLFLDLDNFKVVNDTQGHEAGDKLLKKVAERLISCAPSGAIVARLGGDEFCVLAEGLDSVNSANALARNVIAALKQPIRVRYSEVCVSTSIGVAYEQAFVDDPEVILRNADTAMYHAKEAGKSGYAVFYQSMNDRVVEQLELETGLRNALANDELKVHYQPLMDLASGSIRGVEALIRWEHPTRGLIPPDKFIPVAEKGGLIVPIGFFVLDRACREILRVQGQGLDTPPLILNVNVSGAQLQRGDFVKRVSDILLRTGFDATNLKLEITETTLMNNTGPIISQLHQLRELGVKLAIDDFGTGYSSMASLSNLPVDTVKIDRSFVTPITDRDEALTIVKAIIMISRSLKLDVTAEGVETEEQMAKLQELGCDLGQGYFFSRALPSGELVDWLRAQSGPRRFRLNPVPRGLAPLQAGDLRLNPIRKAA